MVAFGCGVTSHAKAQPFAGEERLRTMELLMPIAMRFSARFLSSGMDFDVSPWFFLTLDTLLSVSKYKQ